MMRRLLLVTGLVAGTYIAGAQLHSQPLPTTTPVRTDPVSFRDVVKGVLPAVVSIDSKVIRGKNRRAAANDNSSPEDFQKFFDELERRQQQTPSPSEQNIGFGSGFIVDPKGIVLTNFHVIEKADKVEITLTDGRKFTSTEILGDQKTDLAIVRFDPKGAKLPWLEFGDSNQMEIGDRVLAVGAPFGLSGTVTHGIISAKGRDLGLNRFDDFVQTDAAINPGNSGGPLVNLEGKVVGVNSAIQSKTGGFQGVSMAISSNMAKGVMQSLVKDGIVKRPYIGIEAAQAQPGQLADLGAAEGGVLVAGVREQTPASRGGIKANDVIVGIAGKPIKEFRDLTKAIAAERVGATIEVSVIREGLPISLKVKLEEEPKDYGASPIRRLPFRGEVVRVPAVGLGLATISAEMATTLQVKGGAVVVSVDRSGLAAGAGFAPGVVILKINGRSITTAEEAKKVIETGLEGDGVTLSVRIGGRTVEYHLKAN
ncbi:MAG: trypsin-like peptidase domain-containing protein [Gemmataceae bacterium]|nr:trypsin-like peptidase domain-containing protein [Gemmataceae bacterium]